MKVVTTNLLNRFWKNGIRPIIEGVANKVDTSKIVQSTNITEDGFLMDGKTASEEFAELNRKFKDYSKLETFFKKWLKSSVLGTSRKKRVRFYYYFTTFALINGLPDIMSGSLFFYALL